jgi:hypothetical protein
MAPNCCRCFLLFLDDICTILTWIRANFWSGNNAGAFLTWQWHVVLLSAKYAVYVAMIFVSSEKQHHRKYMKIKVWARVRCQGRSCSICGAQSGTGTGLLTLFRFILLILIPPVAPHSLITLPFAMLLTAPVRKQLNKGYVSCLLSQIWWQYVRSPNIWEPSDVSKFVQFHQALCVDLPFLSEY